MELLKYVFHLGVLFAIFGFIWGIFDIGVRLLTAGRQRSLNEEYLIKLFKYIFLTDVTFLFAFQNAQENPMDYYVIISGFVLLIYFIGKLQKKQNQLAFIQFSGSAFPQRQINFNLKYEITTISIAGLLFAFFVFFPNYSSNAISLWMYETIIDLVDTPIFGFIFKVIGFFFLVNIILKMVNTVMYFITGQPFIKTTSFENKEGRKGNDKNDFDDFEEIN